MSVDKERRAAGSRRISFQTLVEIGAGTDGSAAFEAESVNVTTAGMHLRTAYLPEIGEPMMCRFDAAGREVVAQGQVVWRNEEAYGGDFGVRFLNIDGASLDALRELAGEPCDEAPDPSEAEADPSQVARGTRVRLHIDGLGAPMKARVKDTTRSEVMVGSNLEFLKIGRSVDLENADDQGSRTARIERVSIEIEPTSHIPQLVVALRYLDAAEEPEPVTAYAADDPEEEPTCSTVNYDLPEDESPQAIDKGSDKAQAVWSKVKEVGPALAMLSGKAMTLGGKAKQLVGVAVEKTRGIKQNADDAPRPKRVTSPPPKGGLRGDGRRMAPDQADDELPEAPKRLKVTKTKAGIAAALVLLAVVSFVLARGNDNVEAAAPADPNAAELAMAEAPAAFGAAPTGVVANVPLFGSTPMSTALVVPPAIPAAPAEAFAAAPSDEDLEGEGDEEMGASAPAAAAGAGDDELAGDDEAVEAPAAQKPKQKAASSRPARAAATKARSFGRGTVRNPTVLTLQMNREIKDLRGSATSDGFRVDVVGARSKEAAAGLRRHDRRIAAASVINSGDNAAFTMRFRGGVPAYRIQAQGTTLRILLGNDKTDKKTAKKPDRAAKSKKRAHD